MKYWLKFSFNIIIFQVNLEAKVAFSSSIGRGLIEEARGISADYILIGSSKNRTNR